MAAARVAPPVSFRPFPQPGPSQQSLSSPTSFCLTCDFEPMPSNARLNNEGAVQRLLIPNGGIDAWMVTIGAVPRTLLSICASATPPAPGSLPARPHHTAGVAGWFQLPVVLSPRLGFPRATRP